MYKNNQCLTRVYCLSKGSGRLSNRRHELRPSCTQLVVQIRRAMRGGDPDVFIWYKADANPRHIGEMHNTLFVQTASGALSLLDVSRSRWTLIVCCYIDHVATCYFTYPLLDLDLCTTKVQHRARESSSQICWHTLSISTYSFLLGNNLQTVWA